MDTHQIWIIVRKDTTSAREDYYRYAAQPCISWEEAFDTLSENAYPNVLDVTYIDNGATGHEIDPETGEIVAEWIIKMVGRL